ncbi:phage major capsid protein [Clostridium sp. K12(2020)]|uniref:phage major capsid protein n=1 Tax=unclassified Clostridium TaxID=2614128 RepID=UPI001C8BD699|nr:MULTISPECIES: phage major capsid protein [unclassified Clostridium]MBX9139240.1 phage major capsid protein [Clostridium sp. K12(2020)]MBX9145995.1 phage major capsid protein [Clostridium sp. K13]
MKFKNIAEAFNYYRNHSKAEIEKRTAEIGNLINTDPNIDIQELNIELEGLKQAKENIEERSQGSQQFNPITGMSFAGATESVKGDVFESTEYRNAFFKTMLGQKLTDVEERTFKRAMEIVDTEKRADAFSTTTNSAAILPTQTLNEIIKKARTIGGLISHCRSFNIPSNISVPIGTPSTKANWHTEGEKVDSENPSEKIAKVSFAGYEIIKIFSISASSKKMSISAFESYIIEELTNCVMECIADSLVNGTGVNQGTGIATGITWNGENSFTFTDNVVYTDLTKMLAKLKRGYSAGAKWAMNNATLYNSVYGIVDTTGRPIFIADPKNENIGYILGKPVIIDDNIADDTIFLGNFNYLGYNIPEGIVVETSRESSFKYGVIDYRALAIADTKPLVSEAFIKLSKVE